MNLNVGIGSHGASLESATIGHMERVDRVWVVPAGRPDDAVAATARGDGVVVVGNDAEAVLIGLARLPRDARRIAGWIGTTGPGGFDGLREMLAELYPGAEVCVAGGGSLDGATETLW